MQKRMPLRLRERDGHTLRESCASEAGEAEESVHVQRQRTTSTRVALQGKRKMLQ